MKQVFSECGTVQRVILQEKPTSGPSPNSSAAQESLFMPPIQHLVSSSSIGDALEILLLLSCFGEKCLQNLVIINAYRKCTSTFVKIKGNFGIGLFGYVWT